MPETETKHAVKHASKPLDTESNAQTELNRLLTRDEYRATIPKLFPSDEALAWFIRRHKQRLLRGGAIVYFNRRPFLDPVRMAPIVLEVGRAVAIAA